MIEKREKRKKIFYVPGMISLVLIPLVCIVYFYKTNAFKVYGAINLALPNKGDFEKYEVENLREYKVYKFSGNEFDDKKKLNEMRFYLRKLSNEKDTINGIKLQYNAKTNYDIFIKTLDVLAIENPPTWGMFGNNIYIIANSNSPKKVKKNSSVTHTMNCGTMEVMKQQAYWEQKNRKEEETRVFQVSFFAQKWKLIFCAYAGLIFLNIFALVKLNKR
ncbi:hypothetical protein L1276_004650 [Flavobacterium sp. HSC-32F16]|uniref:hypothetical protein n=1 Tax=Flavobacterium sp. HSC-32F16 TaxID=2910964 RepID=UPI0020A2DE1C|nr:hypothetical protein [Flavobacterium sp. HSC-32F16]MCP2029463.1 hypothetical protein [Flavobacterium sp. HSC-32F16]